MSVFKSPKEFCEVMNLTFTLMSTDPAIGPKLKDARLPQRLEFPDIKKVVNITYSEGDDYDNCLKWVWNDKIDWEPEVEMSMDSDVANKFFQGKENIAIALARRRIKVGGNLHKALTLVPLIKPVFEQYRKIVDEDYPHLSI